MTFRLNQLNQQEVIQQTKGNVKDEMEMNDIIDDIFETVLDQAEAERFEEEVTDYGSLLPEQRPDGHNHTYKEACCVDNCPMIRGCRRIPP